MNDTDAQILALAKRMFIENGVIATDMKDIARELGCSRSTLYRHFPSKGDILLVLAEEAIDIIFKSINVPETARFMNGFDAFSWQLNALMESLIEHVDEVTFLRDFDCMYTKAYPDTPSTSRFLKYVNATNNTVNLIGSVKQGMADGSIKRVQNPSLLIATTVHACLGLAQRVMPREQFFVSEHGYGQEMLRYYVNITLEAIRGDR